MSLNKRLLVTVGTSKFAAFSSAAALVLVLAFCAVKICATLWSQCAISFFLPAVWIGKEAGLEIFLGQLLLRGSTFLTQLLLFHR